MMQAVHLACGLPAILPEEWTKAVKQADHAAAFLEAVQVAGFDEAEARSVLRFRGNVPAVNLEPWSAEQARTQFLV